VVAAAVVTCGLCGLAAEVVLGVVNWEKPQLSVSFGLCKSVAEEVGVGVGGNEPKKFSSGVWLLRASEEIDERGCWATWATFKGALPMYASSVLCFLVFTCRLCMYPHTRGPVIYPLSMISIKLGRPVPSSLALALVSAPPPSFSCPIHGDTGNAQLRFFRRRIFLV
jgi:hypothetical protein